MIIPLTASPGPPWPPTLTSLTHTRRKGCDELANVFRIFFKSNLRDPEHEHVVDLWTPSSQSFMTRVSLTNCQLNCCPLPQPGPVFALVCHIMCHWSPPPPPPNTSHLGSGLTSLRSQQTIRNCLHPLTISICPSISGLFTTITCWCFQFSLSWPQISTNFAISKTDHVHDYTHLMSAMRK